MPEFKLYISKSAHQTACSGNGQVFTNIDINRFSFAAQIKNFYHSFMLRTVYVECTRGIKRTYQTNILISLHGNNGKFDPK